MNPLFCADGTPDFLKIFNLSVAPQLLFYTYIPAIVIATFLGFYVFKKSRTLEGKLFSIITGLFTLWVLDILMLWIVAYNKIIMFSWQITPIFEVPLIIFIVYFILVVTDKERKDINPKIKILFLTIMTLVLASLTTQLNLPFYNLDSCEGVPGILWDLIYTFEIIATTWIIGICIERYRKLNKLDAYRKEIVYFGIGTVAFMILFVGANIVGQITTIQVLSFWDSLGMVVFLGFLVYMIVRYKEFNIKLLATQALVWGLAILIGSQFFYVKDFTNLILTGVTFVASIFFGYFLIQSVKKEIILREQLQVANEGQATLIHFINHQIKGYLSKGRSIYAELLSEDDYGPLNDSAKEMLKTGEESLKEGVEFVQDILKSSDIDKGTMAYNMESLDFKKIVNDMAEDQKKFATDKGLQYELNIQDADYEMRGDINQLKEAVRNLINNSISYTPEGSIHILLAKENNKIRFVVKDTGVGLSDELKPKLFTKGGTDKDSRKINVNSTGFGLSIVKGVIDAHHGKVWAESEGVGKGSTFTVELPVN